MLTTNEYLTLEDYVCKSSPESCSSNSYFTDYSDFASDEDFLQQLSSDLDIPLLLNPGDDEMNLFNSFFDRSPEEIMSEIISNEPEPLKPKYQSEVKIEPDGSSCSPSSLSPVQSPRTLNYYAIKDELKDEPMDVEQQKPVVSPVPKILPKIAPTQKKVVLFKNSTGGSPPPPKVVLLENMTALTTAPVATHTVLPPMLLKKSVGGGAIDAKILKRQQRKIKNRESACLSRKKKKDYVTSLENQVKELMVENQKLKADNSQLMERLKHYEGPPLKPNNAKTNIVLCMLMFSIAFHFDYIKSPFVGNSVNIIQNESPKIVGRSGRNLLWSPEDVINATFSSFSMCPAAINQTESARLALELERWIGKPQDLISANQTSVPKIPRRRKSRKYQTFISYSQTFDNTPVGGNELQVFKATPEQIYSEFFEAIKRQDDTFYVVSFSEHHMLLPALHHNKTRRPKMSLIMPAVLPNANTTQPSLVRLMQIDCEVLDTRLIQVRYGSIPEHLRKGNTTFHQKNMTKSTTKSSSNYTARKPYKPFFMKKTAPERGLF